MSIAIGRRGYSISVEDQGVNWRVQFWYRWNGGDYQFADVSFPSAFGDLNPDEVESLMVQLTVEVLRGRGLLPED
jgi:hypothetical protein